MKILKNNFYDIVKLYVNHIGIMIFSLFLMTAAGAIETDSTLPGLFVSIGSMLFYYFLIYFVTWEIGAKDKIRLDSGKYERTPMKGALLGLFANAPHILISLICTIVALICSGGQLSFSNGFLGAMYVIMTFHGGPYQGLVHSAVIGNIPNAYYAEQTTNSAGEIVTTMVQDPSVTILPSALAHLLIPLIAVLVTHLAYTLGSKDIKITGLFKKK